MEILTQILIASFGITSCYLTATNRPNWACIWGLCAEPAWMYHAITSKAWGVFILAIIYAILWGYGVYRYWIKK